MKITISFLALLAFVGVFFVSPVSAQPGYSPPPKTPMVPDERFLPKRSDKKTRDRTHETLKEYNRVQSSQGKEVARDYSGSRKEFDRHPWKADEGRNPAYAKMDWVLDSQAAVFNGFAFVTDAFSPPDVEPRDSGEINTSGFGLFGMLKNLETLVYECFEPRLAFPISTRCSPSARRFAKDNTFSPPSCPYKRNKGYIFGAWWPEYTIDVNNYGVVAINAAAHGRPDLAPLALEETKKTVIDAKIGLVMEGALGLKPETMPSKLREKPHIGNTQWSGLLPGDQTYQNEVHIYETAIDDWASEKRDPDKWVIGFYYRKIPKINICVPGGLTIYNGYKREDTKYCGYTPLEPEEKDVHAFTEEMPYATFWQFPYPSAGIDSSLYRASVPVHVPGSIEGLAKETAVDSPLPFYARTRSCASFRADKWKDEFQDLVAAVGIVPRTSSALEKICYRGGGQLYPLSGQLLGHFNPFTSAAFLGRRAIELASTKKDVIASLRDSKEDRVLYFDDKVDKLQMVYPRVTSCFRINDTPGASGLFSWFSTEPKKLPYVDEKDHDLFPLGLEKPKQLGTVRYIYWNYKMFDVCEWRAIWKDGIPHMGFGGGCEVYDNNIFPIPIIDPDVGRGDKEDQPVNSWGPLPDWPIYAEALVQHYPWYGR